MILQGASRFAEADTETMDMQLWAVLTALDDMMPVRAKVNRRPIWSIPMLRFQRNQSIDLLQAVRHTDRAWWGRERMCNPRLKLGLEQIYRECAEILADLLQVEGDRRHPSTARWHRSPPGPVAQST